MSQCYIMSVNRVVTSNAGNTSTVNPPAAKEKVMSYEEKTVGSTPFFKCEACPYMALAEDDIKFHLFTVHPELAKTNGLADNIQINCPGCVSIFDAEETLRNHLRNHHKMGIKDVKKMVKSLVQIALKDAKLKKEDKTPDPPPGPIRQEIAEVKIPQLIEIVPDVSANNESLPKGVAFISVDELNKMSTPNFEKVDPKEIIQEASINIVYTNEVAAQFVNVSNTGTSNTNCSVLQVSSVTPDLISSIQPHVAAVIDKTRLSPPRTIENNIDSKSHIPQVLKPCLSVGPISCTLKDHDLKDHSLSEHEREMKLGKLCSVNNCVLRLKDENKLAYHRKCHRNGQLHCPECVKVFVTVEVLHTHLWKEHAVDIELPTCEICGFKTYSKYRLYNVHMKCHRKIKAYSCPHCSKCFKNSNQLAKHKMIHKKEEVVPTTTQCSICQLQFSSERRMKAHVAAVHEKLRPFKCPQCDFTAARKPEIKLHLRSHTGDKPYACDQCMYRSADHNAMRRHKKSHGKESAYKCKYCPFSTIQSTCFTSHMISKHPNINSDDVHRCPYCRFKTVNKDKYVVHLTTHTDKEGIQLLIEMTKNIKNKPSWTIPSDNSDKNSSEQVSQDQNKEPDDKIDSSIDVEVYDCDSISESLPQDYSKTFTTNTSNVQQTDFNNQVMVQDLSKDDNNSDCLISESSNDTMMERHQYAPQLPLQMAYDNPQSNLHGFLNTSVSMEQNLLQNNNVNSLATSHSSIGGNIGNNIMSNFPIRLPHAPQISVRNNITLKPVDKISIPLTTKVTGPIITPTQILPVPSSSNSPVNMTNDPDGAPRKKPKISVKSNLILKGPDQVNMFHSQQKMAFKRLEDNERFGLGGPVTFNNLITTQFMQLQPEPTLSESPNNIMPYPQDTLMVDTANTPVDNGINDTSQIFTFNQQMNVNQMTMLPPPQKIQTNDPSYIKLEATIKQNTQSPSLERMCNANLLSNQALNREYKASPPLEDIHKNMNEIKNEVKSDTYYNLTLNNNATNPSVIDQYLIDNIIGEQYNGHLDLSAVVLPEVSDDQQNDVIEIDDNSDDNKLLPRFDMNFPLESLYLMHNDFHFLENDVSANTMPADVNDMNRIVPEIPIINQKDNLEMSDSSNNDFQNFIQGKKDPMMNTSVRPTTNKINVKNIELMKN
uniref:C2H2-type domain-containing protein n=1 Tax=Pectinophora gossypiella TaxID=13191 RepID=A0A1E1W141_PECGO